MVAELMRLRTTSNDLLVLQVLAVFALTFTAVILPATLSVIWLLNALGVIDRSAAKSMGIPTLSTISGVLSATVAYFKIRRETSSA